MAADTASRKLREAMADMVNDIDKSYIRRMQGDMHRCAAKCCDDGSRSIESVQSCVKDCQSDLTAATGYVQREIAAFEGKLERCAMDCQDKVREKVTPGTKPEDMDKFRQMYEDCAFKCIDTNIHSLSGLTSRIKSNIKAKSYATNFL